MATATAAPIAATAVTAVTAAAVSSVIETHAKTMQQIADCN